MNKLGCLLLLVRNTLNYMLFNTYSPKATHFLFLAISLQSIAICMYSNLPVGSIELSLPSGLVVAGTPCLCKCVSMLHYYSAANLRQLPDTFISNKLPSHFILWKAYEDATWLNVEGKSTSKCWIQIAPRFDGFRNADESKQTAETKKSAHWLFCNCLPQKNIDSENRK